MHSRAQLDLSVVIPVYRSATTLPTMVNRLLAVLQDTGLRHEIILIDDGSPDDSWKELQDLHLEYPNAIVAIQLMRNFGQHNALMCGLRHAHGRFVVTMDDDMQNLPEDIPKLLNAIQEGQSDLVYGEYIQKKHHLVRNLGSRLVYAFYRIVFRSTINPTSFRIIRQELLQSIMSYDLNFTFVDGLLAWNTQRVSTVRVEHRSRQKGTSGYSFAKLLTLALNMFTNFSLLPLQLVSLTGFVVALAGFICGFYYLLQFVTQRIAVPGYASMIIAILVLGGLQLLALGVIGEYLGRLHLNVNRKPQYTIRDSVGCEPSDQAARYASNKRSR